VGFLGLKDGPHAPTTDFAEETIAADGRGDLAVRVAGSAGDVGFCGRGVESGGRSGGFVFRGDFGFRVGFGMSLRLRWEIGEGGIEGFPAIAAEARAFPGIDDVAPAFRAEQRHGRNSGLKEAAHMGTSVTVRREGCKAEGGWVLAVESFVSDGSGCEARERRV
jgi:hypothetical protein